MIGSIRSRSTAPNYKTLRTGSRENLGTRLLCLEDDQFAVNSSLFIHIGILQEFFVLIFSRAFSSPRPFQTRDTPPIHSSGCWESFCNAPSLDFTHAFSTYRFRHRSFDERGGCFRPIACKHEIERLKS